MSSTTSSAVPSIVGYVTPFSGTGGQTLSFKISSQGNRPFQAHVVRIDCSDPNPAGPGMKLVPVDFGLTGLHDGMEQAVFPGSCAHGPLPALGEVRELVIEFAVRPTLRNERRQTLLALQDDAGVVGLALVLQDGEIRLCDLGPKQGTASPPATPSGIALPLARWSQLRVSWKARGGVSIEVASIDPLETPRATRVELPSDFHLAWPALRRIAFAAIWRGHPVDAFNGLIESPTLLADGQAIARWDFAQSPHEQSIADACDAARALTLVNLPARAMRSSRWSGLHMDWKTAPDEYAAIHFHEDDVADCGWQTGLELAIPAGAASGVYGLRVDNGTGVDTIPFYVTPGPVAGRARILFLASTFTYMAYANHARGNFAGALEQRVRDWNAYPHNGDSVGAFSGSTYNRHPDGSGIHLSSRLRPILTMRPGYLTFDDPRGSGLRHFSADSHLTGWLRARGHAFDVITDDELDAQGLAALQGYDVLMTGSHPEYHTRRMLDALMQYRVQGGHLMYLGGNGFYWKIARLPALPHVIEVRRAEGGIRAWEAEPGEYYHQLDGEYGGLWRRNGIAPQKVGGVGFTVQGIFEGSYYLRTEESRDPALAWLFDGVRAGVGERMGDYGLSGGGAAGFELDQASADLGTPDGTRIVAASDGHGPTFKTTPEEILTWTLAAGNPRAHSGIKGHMVVGPNLFAVGSISFLGSLSHNGYDNDMSRILDNCLRKFIAP